MAKRKKTFIDRNGNTVRGVPSYLYMMGVLPYELAPGVPFHPLDSEYFAQDFDLDEVEEDHSGMYLRWTGKINWHVHLVYENDTWNTLHSDTSAAKSFGWMQDFGYSNKIRIDEKLHLPGDVFTSDMMRENAMESMGPKFFVCGDSLDRRGEKYVRLEDDGIPF